MRRPRPMIDHRSSAHFAARFVRTDDARMKSMSHARLKANDDVEIERGTVENACVCEVDILLQSVDVAVSCVCVTDESVRHEFWSRLAVHRRSGAPS